MSDISTKLQYLNTTKGKIKDVINMTGANITSDTTFRNYATKLYDGYISVLKDKNTLLDNMPKGTSTGYITDAADLSMYEDKMSKESTQDGTPTPENPIEVKTVKGYRNLFDKDNINKLNAYFSNGVLASSNNTRTLYIRCLPNTTYTISKISGQRFQVGFTENQPQINEHIYGTIQNQTGTKITITTNSNANYLCVYYYSITADILTEQEILDSIMITEGTEELPYVPYGTNYVAITNTNGTDTNYYTIPLNDNEICGIGNYKDELIVDKNGHCWLNKKIGKVVLDGSENWTSESIVSTLNTQRLRLDNAINTIGVPTTEVANIMSNLYIPISSNSLWFGNVGIAIATGGTNLFIYDTNYNTGNVNDFKSMLSNNNLVIYYPLATPQLIDLNYTVDLTLFEGVNNISNSEDMDVEIKYIKDTYE